MEIDNFVSFQQLRIERNLYRFFLDNDGKVASLREHIIFKAAVLKPYPIYDQNITDKIDTLFMTKTAEKPCPLGPHIPI